MKKEWWLDKPKSLQKQTLYNDIYKFIQQKTHFNGKQMHENFPDVCKLAFEEQFMNVGQVHDKFLRKFKLNYWKEYGKKFGRGDKS